MIRSRNYKIPFALWQTGKYTSAVRETRVSRHHGGPIKGPPKASRASGHYNIEEFTEVPKLGPPLCREMSLSLTAYVNTEKSFFESC